MFHSNLQIKDGVMFYCHTQSDDIRKQSGTDGLGIVGRDIALLCT